MVNKQKIKNNKVIYKVCLLIVTNAHVFVVN